MLLCGNMGSVADEGVGDLFRSAIIAYAVGSVKEAISP
jgi:hypothetical protein